MGPAPNVRHQPRRYHAAPLAIIMYMYLVSTNPKSTLCARSVVVRPAVVCWRSLVRFQLLCICNIFVLPGMYRYIPVCTSSYRYVPVHTGISLYIPVCNSTYMYRLSPSQYKPGTSKYVLYTHTKNTVHTLTAKRYQPPWANTMYMYLVCTFHITNVFTVVAQWHDMPHTMHEVIGSNPAVMHMIYFCLSANLREHTGIYTVRHSTYLS